MLATDAPLLPIQCQRLARRATTGLAWVGGFGANGSGDIFLAFSTGNHVGQNDRISNMRMLAPDAMTSLFQAAAEATEEAILNAMCMAETMSGREGRTVHALPLDLLQEVMQRYRPRKARERRVPPDLLRRMDKAQTRHNAPDRLGGLTRRDRGAVLQQRAA